MKGEEEKRHDGGAVVEILYLHEKGERGEGRANIMIERGHRIGGQPGTRTTAG